MDIHYGRKRSGIIKELNAKLGEWVQSIDNVELRNTVRRDTIVTGGSICSMLMGDPVNDFDVYFKTKDTAIAVARYYVDKFEKVLAEKNDYILYKPEIRQEQLVNCKGIVEDRVYIYMKSAGLASETQSQYVYFEMEDAVSSAGEFASSLKLCGEEDKGEKYRPVFLSPNAITLSHKIQIIIRFFGEAAQIHDNYDFVHAMCYYDFSYNELVLPGPALEAMLSRTLVYKGSLYPVASIFRAKKFIQRGWRISAGQLLKIMWQISELDLSKKEVFMEQLTGVDLAYMYELIRALTDVDPQKINSTYVGEIIDRIFG